ncbi:hypothetical protein AURDEDRAFT_158765 [Auricularia subglabra TFB-10046 SS5]|nr:hypothetical protein AURDEDRAFT_158765 [Auricularia subglabra TFB-10046 SS5]
MSAPDEAKNGADASSEKGSVLVVVQPDEERPANQGLAREMSSRQISMISSSVPSNAQCTWTYPAAVSIGAVIGTGLFVGTASALHNGGPLGLFLAYAIMGTVCYSVMISLGEMVAFLPIEGGHIRLAELFIEPAWGATIGYFYCYFLTYALSSHPQSARHKPTIYSIAMPAELSAAAVIFDYWTHTRINNAVYITVCLVLVVFINFLAVITIVGLVILGIVIDLGGGPTRDRIGFRYWKSPGPFAQYLEIPGSLGRFLGFVSCLNQATFSFIGTEIVAIAAGETKDPRRTLPRAIKAVWVRIVLFYVVGTFVIGLLVPSNEPGLLLGAHDAKGSPFVIAIEKAGIKVLPSIINACLLTSAWSAASSDLYTSSRALCKPPLARG